MEAMEVTREKKCFKFPAVNKCCFCVPVRLGIIIFGYVNLILSLLCIPFLVLVLVVHSISDENIFSEHFPYDTEVHIPLTIAVQVIEVVLDIILLVGAYKKKKTFLWIYFYSDAILQILSLCVDLVFLEYQLSLEYILYYLIMGMNIYLLFLVYNVIQIMDGTLKIKYVVQKDIQPSAV